MKKIRRKKMKSKKGFLYLFLVAVLIIGFVFFIRSDIFTITSISVEGAENIAVSQVIEICGIKTGENIFDFRASKIEKKLRSEIPLLYNVSIVRVYPNTVKIILTERIPLLSIAINAHYYAIDENGMVISDLTTLSPDSGIVLSGINDVEFFVDSFIDYSSDVRLMTAFEVVKWLRSSGNYNYVSEIYAAQSGFYYLYTKKSNIIKFYSLNSFEKNEDFINLFIRDEDRHIMVEVIENSEPVYKVIDIK